MAETREQERGASREVAPRGSSGDFEGVPVRVVGLGNVLMGDDGAGPWVVEELLGRFTFPDGVVVFDLGTPGLDLTPFLSGASTVILVDTVRSDGPPGTLRTYDKEEILRHAPGPRVSPHDPGVKEALQTLELAGTGPTEVLLVGIVPGKVEMSVALTPPVREAIGRAADEVVALLAVRGLIAVPRDPAAPLAPWWTRPA